MTGAYSIKCDGCRAELGRTDSVRESAAGGRCDDCRRRDELEARIAGIVELNPHSYASLQSYRVARAALRRLDEATS